MNKFARLFIYTAVVCMLSFAFCSAESIKIVSGQETILIPTPEGYLEICSKNKSVAAYFQRNMSSENLIVACYVEQNELKSMQQGLRSEFSNYALVTAPTVFGNQEVDKAKFAIFKYYISSHLEKAGGNKSGIDKILDSSSGDSINKAMVGNIGKPVVIVDTADKYAAFMAVDYRFGNAVMSTGMVSAAVNVDGTVLTANFYKTGVVDAKSLSDLALNWLNKISK